jgi:hypothetical protein
LVVLANIVEALREDAEVRDESFLAGISRITSVGASMIVRARVVERIGVEPLQIVMTVWSSNIGIGLTGLEDSVCAVEGKRLPARDAIGTLYLEPSDDGIYPGERVSKKEFIAPKRLQLNRLRQPIAFADNRYWRFDITAWHHRHSGM